MNIVYLNKRPYRPRTGTEGADFQDRWCGHCARDAAFRDGNYEDPELGCKILAATFAYDIHDPRYPKEWVWKHGEGCCTAFTTDPTSPVRCDKTIDMFTGKVGR